jgi:hypothetical protein
MKQSAFATAIWINGVIIFLFAEHHGAIPAAGMNIGVM